MEIVALMRERIADSRGKDARWTHRGSGTAESRAAPTEMLGRYASSDLARSSREGGRLSHRKRDRPVRQRVGRAGANPQRRRGSLLGG